MYIQEENKNRMGDTGNNATPPKTSISQEQVDTIAAQVTQSPAIQNLIGRKPDNNTNAPISEGGVPVTQPQKSKAELIAEAQAELAAAGEDEEKKQTAQAKLDAANAMQDEGENLGADTGPDAAADAIDPEVLRTQKQEQVNVLEEEVKTMPDGDEKTKKEAEIDKLKEEIKAIKGGGRRTRRRNKKGGKKSGKKSRRQSKKGGKKHCKTGSKKSKKSRRYSSRK
jgi:hypothetical protein